MTDALTVAIRRARLAKDAPRQDARVQPAQQPPALAVETVTPASPPPIVLSKSVLNGHPIKVVQHVVAAAYGINVEDLIGQRRTHKFILPRHVAMYVCSEWLQASSVEIGQRFNRDHSTVLHAIWRIAEMRQLDPTFGLEMEKLMEDLRAVKPRRIMSEQQQYTVEEKIAELVRELEHRREVYPFRVTMKVMRQEEADRRLAILEAIAADYRTWIEDWHAEAGE